MYYCLWLKHMDILNALNEEIATYLFLQVWLDLDEADNKTDEPVCHSPRFTLG